MTTESDYLVDRRRLRRKLTFWRVAAFLVAAVAIVGAGIAFAGRQMFAGSAHIARVDVSGFITGDRKTLELIESLGRNRAASAVLVTINSPGGTVTGSEALYLALRALSAQKPTVAVVEGMAASGGYIAAMGTERIVAQHTSLVGSIGVLFQFPNVVRLLDTVGVKMETVKSAPLKASPNPFEPTVATYWRLVRLVTEPSIAQPPISPPWPLRRSIASHARNPPAAPSNSRLKSMSNVPPIRRSAASAFKSAAMPVSPSVPPGIRLVPGPR